MQLAQHDVVHTATETRQILVINQLVADRYEYRSAQAGTDRQFALLRPGAAARVAAERAAASQQNSELLAELRRVRRAVDEQAYHRLNEQGDLVNRIHREHERRDEIARRYIFK